MNQRARHHPVVIRFGRLGDTILLQPLLHKLRHRYGGACRLVSLGACSRVLYEGNEDVAEVRHFDSQYGSLWFNPQRLRTALSLRELRQSPFYICEPDVRTRTKVRPMLALAGIPSEQCVFIEDTPMHEGEHWVDWLMRFADETPCAFRDALRLDRAMPCAPRLQPTTAELDEAHRWLAHRDMLGHPLVLLQPANKRTMRWNGVRKREDDDKSWPVDRWAALCVAILAEMPDARVLLCGSAAEAGYLATIGHAAAHAHVVVPREGLPLGHLRALLHIAHSMVSVDTGPAHLAAAVGCPLVVLFGNRWPSMWMPRSAAGSAVHAIGGLPDVPRVDHIALGDVTRAWRQLPPRPGHAAHQRMDRMGWTDAFGRYHSSGLA
ncbi:heptosyltransferase-3 [Dyella jiangningensis]|uniref:glycosyltransferase family 9 protein n=1 Tax=Dyella sp. AtDHG13 TaxID=1938897 RepID=UPI0008831DC6|nr:glycosyltransferase family 9 protein [Dyella sp. AtDHG13]PXV53135.1 heptosyltransferase-2/heptosyltransferase-3 [Dyella sp. AtDHG13]SDL58106.1 heptosyltransferase-3 [Dyella jiangningensis]